METRRRDAPTTDPAHLPFGSHLRVELPALHTLAGVAFDGIPGIMSICLEFACGMLPHRSQRSTVSVGCRSGGRRAASQERRSSHDVGTDSSHLQRSGRFEAVVSDSCHVRRFLDDAVPREDIEHMVGVASARSAPATRRSGASSRSRIASWSPPCRPRSSSASSSSPCGRGWRSRSRSAWWRARRPFSSPRRRSASRCWRRRTTRRWKSSWTRRHQPGGARSSVRTAGAAERRGGGAAALHLGPCHGLCRLLDVRADRGRRAPRGAPRGRPPARLVALVRIGRPAELPAAHKRLPLDQVLSFR